MFMTVRLVALELRNHYVSFDHVLFVFFNYWWIVTFLNLFLDHCSRHPGQEHGEDQETSQQQQHELNVLGNCVSSATRGQIERYYIDYYFVLWSWKKKTSIFITFLMYKCMFIYINIIPWLYIYRKYLDIYFIEFSNLIRFIFLSL
jgi:hypothetical protein